MYGETRLPRPTYQVLQEIDEGVSGECVLAFHEIFQQKVVRKTVELMGFSDAFAYSEPSLLKSIRHKNIVEVWDAEWAAGFDPILKVATFTMPYYEGESLGRALLTGHRFSLGEAIGIANGVLDALHCLHVVHRLLHRDIKPGNVMLDVTRTIPYLGDLGSAAPMSGTGDAEARGGTYLYRPPESYLGRYDVRSEMYSLGITMLECLNGPLPYQQLDDHIAESDARLAKGKSPLPTGLLALSPHVPRNLARLVKKMVHTDPSRRPATALEVQTALRSIVHMNWREVAVDEDRRWEGYFRASKPSAVGRFYEVDAVSVTRGPNAGNIRLRARWKADGAETWRNIASLDRYVGPDNRANVAQFFEDLGDHVIRGK